MGRIELWIGTNKAHGSLRIKPPWTIEDRRKDERGVAGFISSGWSRFAVLAGRGEQTRFFEIVPAEGEEGAICDGDYFLRGSSRSHGRLPLLGLGDGLMRRGRVGGWTLEQTQNEMFEESLQGLMNDLFHRCWQPLTP